MVYCSTSGHAPQSPCQGDEGGHRFRLRPRHQAAFDRMDLGVRVETGRPLNARGLPMSTPECEEALKRRRHTKEVKTYGNKKLYQLHGIREKLESDM